MPIFEDIPTTETVESINARREAEDPFLREFMPQARRAMEARKHLPDKSRRLKDRWPWDRK